MNDFRKIDCFRLETDADFMKHCKKFPKTLEVWNKYRGKTVTNDYGVIGFVVGMSGINKHLGHNEVDTSSITLIIQTDREEPTWMDLVRGDYVDQTLITNEDTCVSVLASQRAYYIIQQEYRIIELEIID